MNLANYLDKQCEMARQENDKLQNRAYRRVG